MLFLGGLDSSFAVCNMIEQGYDVELLHFDQGTLISNNLSKIRYNELINTYPKININIRSINTSGLIRKIALTALSELSEASKQHFATPDKLWYLYLQGLYRDHTEQRAVLERFLPSQEFCLIITIRDPEQQANVYDEVTQGLDTYNFWHSNIKISSEVSSRLNS